MKILFVCTGNIARSPTAEEVLRLMTNGTHQARSAGISASAVRPISEEDVCWADLVAVMEHEHRNFILQRWPEAEPKLRVLGIPDRYPPRDPLLIHLLELKLGGLVADAGRGSEA